MEKGGYIKVSSFMTRNARFMVTSAELAMEDMETLYITNKIERLKGEISKRYKLKWMR